MGKTSAKCVKLPGLSVALLTLATVGFIHTADAKITGIVERAQ